MPASAAGLGSGVCAMASVSEQGSSFDCACRSLGVIHKPQSHYPLASGAPAVGTWANPLLLWALVIDWELTYNLIFYLLISPTEAASCQWGDGEINENLV